ncbi:MAG TPA: GNAT family N-acetyltransferase, partial [Albitalea sp.]|nr:GNAT family N-acetyltransferase [Albitalea sp.]
MISNCEVTLAQPADAIAIAELSRDAIEQGLGWSWTPRRVLRSVRDASTNVAVARRDGALLGFAIMQYGDEDAHLLLLAVRAAQRRQGVGKALLAWLETTARVAGIALIRLETRASNMGGRSFYS